MHQEGDKRIWHVQAYAVVRRGAFDPTLFQGVHDLVVLPEWRSSAIAEGQAIPVRFALWALTDGETWMDRWSSTEMAYLENWPEKFDCVLLTGPVGRPADELPSWLGPVSGSGRYALFEIRPEDIPASRRRGRAGGPR